MFIELRHLRAMTALRECDNFAAAAQQLFVTQSALSHLIKNIENYYEQPLFVRKSRPLRFTPLGLRLLELADETLPTIMAAEQVMRQISSSSQGRLHLAIECHACFDWLIPTMDRYRKHWPEVEMDISVGYTFDPLPALARGNIDLVITSDPQAINGVVYEPLFDYQGLLAMAPEHELAQQAFITPSDLANQTLITYPVEHKRLDVYRYFLDPAGVTPAGHRTSELTVMIMQLVASKRGVAVLPNWVLMDYIKRDYVKARPLKNTTDESGTWGTLYAAVRSSDRQLAFVNAFIEQAQTTAFEILQGIRRTGT